MVERRSRGIKLKIGCKVSLSGSRPRGVRGVVKGRVRKQMGEKWQAYVCARGCCECGWFLFLTFLQSLLAAPSETCVASRTVEVDMDGDGQS